MPTELVPEPRDRGPMHDRLEPEAPWFLEEVVAPRATVAQSRVAVGSVFAVIVNDEERRLIVTAGYGSEEVRGLAGSHFRLHAWSLGDTRIEPRPGDGPSPVDEGLQITDRITAGH